MPKNICQDNFSHSCFKMASFIRHLMLIFLLRMDLVSIDVTFIKNAPFSQSLIHTSQGEDDNFLVYTLSSPILAHVPLPTKPPITKVYTRPNTPLVSSPPPPASTSNPVLSDDFLFFFDR